MNQTLNGSHSKEIPFVMDYHTLRCLKVYGFLYRHGWVWDYASLPRFSLFYWVKLTFYIMASDAVFHFFFGVVLEAANPTTV
jgi:hypothetical protein